MSAHRWWTLPAVKDKSTSDKFRNGGNLLFPPRLTPPEMGPAMVLASSPLPPNFPRVQISFQPFRCTNWTYFDRILANLLLHCFPKAFLPQFRHLDRGLLHIGHRRGLFFPTLFPLPFGVVPLLAGCDCDSFRFFRLGFFTSF